VEGINSLKHVIQVEYSVGPLIVGGAMNRPSRKQDVRSDVLMVVNITITVFRDADPAYSDRYQSFWGTPCLQLQGIRRWNPYIQTNP
jgi:hypothetical protein